MFKRLRIQFVVITLTLVGVVMAATLGVSCYSNYSTQYSITMESLEKGLRSASAGTSGILTDTDLDAPSDSGSHAVS